MKLKLLLIYLLLSILSAQSSITGSVTRSDNGEPLLGVNVLVQNTFMGTTTGIDGQFIIDQLNPGEYTLVISMELRKPTIHRRGRQSLGGLVDV